MNNINKPILCLDFDGVCSTYESGWQGADVINDPPVNGLMDFLFAAHQYFDVQIYSSRNNQDGGIEAMRNWFSNVFTTYVNDDKYKFDLPDWIKFPVNKPSAMITIDDRAITFTGVWPNIETLKNFKPWNKK